MSHLVLEPTPLALISKIFLITMIALFSSCGLLNNGTKKKIFLVDSPKDLEEYLEKNVNRDTIECQNEGSFTIKYEYRNSW